MPLRTFSRESEIDCFYNVARFGGRHVLDSFTENRLLYRCFPPVAYGWRTLPVEVPVNSGSSAAERQLHLLPDDESFVSTVVHNAGIYNGIVALGLIAAASYGRKAFGIQIALLAGVVVAGLFGGATLSPKTFAQAALGAIGILVVSL